MSTILTIDAQLPSSVQAGHTATGTVSGTIVSTASTVNVTALVVSINSGDATVVTSFTPTTLTNSPSINAAYSYTGVVAGGILDPNNDITTGYMTLYANGATATDSFTISSVGAELAYRGRLIDEELI